MDTKCRGTQQKVDRWKENRFKKQSALSDEARRRRGYSRLHTLTLPPTQPLDATLTDSLARVGCVKLCTAPGTAIWNPATWEGTRALESGRCECADGTQSCRYQCNRRDRDWCRIVRIGCVDAEREEGAGDKAEE